MPKFDESNGNVLDDSGRVVMNCGRKPSDEMMKLFVEKYDLAYNSDEHRKIEKKIKLQEIKDQPYIVSTPSYCYAYLLFKLRKLSGLNQDEMAERICMSKSSLAKIENRFATVDVDILHITMQSFGINPMEFSELYWYVQGLVQTNGNFYIPVRISNFNTENEKYSDSAISDYDRCTPINLYDKKVLKSVLEKLEMKFHETILIGKKRLMEAEEIRIKKEAEDELKYQEFEKLSFEEQRAIRDQDEYEQEINNQRFIERLENQCKE